MTAEEGGIAVDTPEGSEVKKLRSEAESEDTDLLFKSERIRLLIQRCFGDNGGLLEELTAGSSATLRSTIQQRLSEMKFFKKPNFASVRSGILDLLHVCCLHAEPDTHAMDTGEGTSSMGSVLRMPDLDAAPHTAEHSAVLFLTMLHGRILCEKSNAFVTDYESEFCTLMASCVLHSLAFALRGDMAPKLSASRVRVAFIRLSFLGTLTPVFMQDLVVSCATHSNTNLLKQVFDPILAWQRDSIVGQTFTTPDNILHLPLQFLQQLVVIKLPNSTRRPIADLIVNRDDFLPESFTSAAEGREIQRRSFLGPFFSVGLSGEETNFMACSELGSSDTYPDESSRMLSKALHSRFASLRTRLHALMHQLLANTSSRSRALDFIEVVIVQNKKRAQMRADVSKLASHSFTINFLSVLLELSSKFGLDKVDFLYPLRPGARCPLEDETRFRMDSTEAASYANTLEGAQDAKFTTISFFLTARALSLGLPCVLNKLKDQHRLHNDYKQRVKDLEEQVQRIPAGPLGQIARSRAQAEVQRLRNGMKVLMRSVHGFELIATDPFFVDQSMVFSDKLLALLCNSINGDFHADGQIPAEPPKQFAAYPEFYLENILDLFRFCLKHGGELLERRNEWPSLLLIFMCSTEFFKNPFLVAKIVEVAAMLSPESNPNVHNLWENMVTHTVATRLLMPSLVVFYSNVEESDFYEKFNIRRNIQIIFKCLWNNAVYRSSIGRIARECSNSFVRFVNMIINDATFLLDESLASLKKIHDLEGLMHRKPEWEALSDEERQQNEGALEEAKRHVKSWLYFGHHTLDLLQYLTADAKEPFLKPVLGERLASMLDHNLSQLCGKKCTELKVNDAERRFQWKPRELTEQVVSVYLNLSCEKFAEYIAHDERSYTPEVMRECVNRMAQYNVIPGHHLELFRNLCEQADRLYKSKQCDEIELEDAPEEYKDPVMDTVMEDPVRLPSNHVMDRKHIMRHLLSSKTNPFTREPLTEEQLVAETELRDKIRAWVKEKLGK